MDGLEVGGFLIPDQEFSWSFSPSGGPGGQHANRSNTRADLRFDLAASKAFPDEIKEYMLGRLRLPTGVLAITADEHRSQLRNREAALERLGKILTESMVRPRRRRATKPSAASKQRRLDQKKVRSEVKKQRRPQNDD